MHYQVILETALTWLSRRRLTVHEMKQLLSKRYPKNQDDITQAIDRLQKVGYLDDKAYIQAYVSDRMRFKPRGKRLLRVELMKKGIAKPLIEHGLTTETIDEVEAAQRLAHSYMKRSRFKQSATQRHILFRYLVGKGFDYGVVRDVVEQLVG